MAVGETNRWKRWPVRTTEANGLVPVGPVHGGGDAVAVDAVEAHIQVIQRRGADEIIPADPRVVGEEGMKVVRVERIGKRGAAGQSLLVAAVVGKEEFALRRQILVDADRHRGIQNRIAGDIEKVVQVPRVGWLRKKSHDLLGDVAERRYLVAGESRAALHP